MRIDDSRVIYGTVKSGKNMTDIIYAARFKAKQKYRFNLIKRHKYFIKLFNLFCDYERGK